MEPPVALLGAEQGPRAAHRLLREHQTAALCVVDQTKRLHGVVYENSVAEAVAAGKMSLEGLIQRMPAVSANTLLADLMGAASEHAAGLAVIDAGGKLQGVIPRVTLLNALSDPHSQGVVQEILQETTS